MNCIIGADKATCKLLEEFAGKSSSLTLLGTYNDQVSVRNQFSKRQDIELLILDIEILKEDCFDFISNLDYKPLIILLSSSHKFAVKAFDLGVIDYLMKPVTYSTFFRAIDKAIKYHIRKEVKNTNDNEIYIKNDSSLVKLKLKNIIYIEALENYVSLFTRDKKFTIHFTMKAMESQLPSDIFIRVHRSFIVNKSMIKTIKEDSLDLTVGDALKSFPVGVSFRELLLQSIKTMTR